MRHFKNALIAAALAQCAFAGAAMAQDAAPQTVTVTLTSYAYAPSMIDLKAGVPVRLHLVNNASKDHNFAAPEFFAASQIAPADKLKVVDGAVELDDGQSVDVTVTPLRAGSYPLNCTHFMHTMLGMTGKIDVR